jgi:hypothetical protein
MVGIIRMIETLVSATKEERVLVQKGKQNNGSFYSVGTHLY